LNIEPIRAFVRNLGLEVHRARPTPLETFLKNRQFTLALDVGANEGQYAKRLRAAGHRGRILSFEPLHAPFTRLLEATASDTEWHAFNCALGAEIGTGEINVGAKDSTSSLRAVTDKAAAFHPGQRVVRTEKVRVDTLDEVLDRYGMDSDTTLLKMDVQGFEDQVLAGGKRSLDKIAAIQMEMAVTAIYEGETLMHEHIAFLASQGFRLMEIEHGQRNAEKELIGVDGFFVR